MDSERTVEDLLKNIEVNSHRLIIALEENKLGEIDILLRYLRQAERGIYEKLKHDKSLTKPQRAILHKRLHELLVILAAEKKDLKTHHLDKLRSMARKEIVVAKEAERELVSTQQAAQVKRQYGKKFPKLIKKIENYKESHFWRDLVKFVGNNQLVILGEVHGTKEIPLLTIEIMELLHSEGFKLLGMEVSRSSMNALERYKQSLNIKHLRKIPFYKALPIASNDGRRTYDHMRVVENAIHIGYEVGFFDMDWKSDKQVLDEYGESTNDFYMAHHFSNIWKSAGRPRSLLFCGGAHSLFSGTGKSSETTMRMFLERETGVKLVTMDVFAGSGSYFSSGVKPYEAESSGFISLLRPDLKRAFFDIRDEPALMNLVGAEAIIYIKNLSPANVPKLSWLGSLRYKIPF